ncbi:MAG TPA: DUF6600 domain-containing protein, partial [Stellaceae bacterium]|nr:DUF6600 domain-containing protein [Stellaceae bacterium]
GIQIALRKGRIGVRLASVDPARSIEIELPHGGVWVLTPGDYDISAGDEHTPARVAVFDGRVRVTAKGLDTAVATGSAVELSGSDPVMARLDGARDDDFVGWWRAAAGDQTEPQALRYVSSEITGYEALDNNGTWETVSGYGAVWFPKSTPDDWAPYRYGHWRWTAPWGWTWIDDMAWGFAPSHYGRWARIASSDPQVERWGWIPGKLVQHPVYAPALVAFLGTAGVGLSCPDGIGAGVAWFPLGPGETYWPSYTNDLDAIRRINDGSVADLSTIGPAVDGAPPAGIVNGTYRNRRAASVVPRAVFLAGRQVAPALVTLPNPRLDNAPLLAGSPQLLPQAPQASRVAAISVGGARVTVAADSRIAHAVQTFTRILEARRHAATIRLAILAHGNRARTALYLTASRPRAASARWIPPRIIAAVAARNANLRLRFAAAHRGAFR